MHAYIYRLYTVEILFRTLVTEFQHILALYSDMHETLLIHLRRNPLFGILHVQISDPKQVDKTTDASQIDTDLSSYSRFTRNPDLRKIGEVWIFGKDDLIEMRFMSLARNAD